MSPRMPRHLDCTVALCCHYAAQAKLQAEADSCGLPGGLSADDLRTLRVVRARWRHIANRNRRCLVVAELRFSDGSVVRRRWAIPRSRLTPWGGAMYRNLKYSSTLDLYDSRGTLNGRAGGLGAAEGTRSRPARAPAPQVGRAYRSRRLGRP